VNSGTGVEEAAACPLRNSACAEMVGRAFQFHGCMLES